MTSYVRFAGPLEIYEWPWWYTPPQRRRGPSYQLTPRQVRKLIRHVEYWMARTQREPTEYALEEADSRDLIETIRLGRCIATFDGEMPQPNSDDSYNCFARRNPHMCLTLAELEERSQERPYERKAAEHQAAWEAARRARQGAKEAEAKRLWDAETSRRTAEPDGQTFWHGLSARFVNQPFVRVRIGPDNIAVRDDEDSSWSVRFYANKSYSVPDEVADLLVRLRSSRL